MTGPGTAVAHWSKPSSPRWSRTPNAGRDARRTGYEGCDACGRLQQPKGIMMVSILRNAARIPEIAVSLMIVALPLLLGAAIYGRETRSFDLVWAEEVTRLLLLWLVFLGAGVASRYDSHLRIDIVATMVRPKWARVLFDLLYRLSLVLMGVILVYLGSLLIQSSEGQTTVVLKIPQSVRYASLPAGGALLLLYGVLGAVKTMRKGPPAVRENAIPPDGAHRTGEVH